MNPTRIARNVSTVAVASIAAWSSWSHMVHAALRFGERPEAAYVLPISVDGILIVASKVIGRVPAVALLLVVEILSRARRTSAEPSSETVLGAGSTPPASGDDQVPSADDALPSSSISAPSPQRRTPHSSARTSGRRRRRDGGTSEAVLRMRADDPRASTADIATQLGVTERHVRVC